MNLSSFKDFFFLSEVTKIQWQKSPAIGWWMDHDPVRFYHGTNIANLPAVFEHGLKAPTSGPTAGWVSLALEPNTAFGYASMGGESDFRAANGRPVAVPANKRAVIVIDLPLAWVKSNMNPHLRGNIEWTKAKLTDKNLYDKWTKSDSEYYMMTEIRVPFVPPQYFVGYMTK